MAYLLIRGAPVPSNSQVKVLLEATLDLKPKLKVGWEVRATKESLNEAPVRTHAEADVSSPSLLHHFFRQEHGDKDHRKTR